MQEHYKNNGDGYNRNKKSLVTRIYTICLRRKTLRIPIEIIIEELYYHGYDMFRRYHDSFAHSADC